jgi:hypothetical protein
MNTRHLICAARVTVAFLCSTANANAQCPPPPDCNSPDPQTTAIQCLLDQGGTIVLQADNCQYGYHIDGTLHLKVSGTTLTSTSAFGHSALLEATPSLNAQMMVVDANVSNYTISNIWFYGNRFNRTNPPCQPDAQYAANLWLRGGGWLLDNVESDTSPCGTSMLVLEDASNYEIRNSWFANNGWEVCNSTQCWADGLTVHSCANGYIHDNHFRDNTDIDLIIGPGQNCRAQTNDIQHTLTFGYGGFMVGFGGDHTGSTYSGNTISSGLDKLQIGVMVGHHPWDKNAWASNGGSVTSNSASGAVFNLVVEGIEAGTVDSNSLGNAQGTRSTCQFRPQVYTAYHYGTATLQPGWSSLFWDSNQCIQF